MHPLSNLVSTITTNPDFISAIKFIGILGTVTLIVSFIFKIFCGKGSSFNQALSSSLGILFVYILTIIIYTFNPYDLSKLLAPLPFVSFEGDSLIVFSFYNAQLTDICSQVLSMIILAFLVNLFDGIMPTGDRLFLWYLWRSLTVLMSMALHYAVSWGFNTFLPNILVTYAPTILLWFLLGMLFIGLLNVILSLLLTVVNPIFGAMYGFFFSTIVGKQFSKAVLATFILCIIVIALNCFGFALIAISASALQAYIPIVLGLLLFWYIVGHM